MKNKFLLIGTAAAGVIVSSNFINNDKVKASEDTKQISTKNVNVNSNTESNLNDLKTKEQNLKANINNINQEITEINKQKQAKKKIILNKLRK